MSNVFELTKGDEKRIIRVFDKNTNEYDFIENGKSSYSICGKSKEIHFEKIKNGVYVSIYCRKTNTTSSFPVMKEFVKGIVEYLKDD